VRYYHEDRTHLGLTQDTPTQTISRRRGRFRHRFTDRRVDFGPTLPSDLLVGRNLGLTVRNSRKKGEVI
jgi:hypothetical protein